jgi:hypothetical protein
METLRKKYANSSLAKKMCTQCKETFPRDDQHFYKRPHPSVKNYASFDAECIRCNNKRTNEYKRKNKERIRLYNVKYKETERGYFKELWQSVRKSAHGCELKTYEEFFDCWLEQQKTYGTRCPYLNVEMTRIKGQNPHTVGGKKTLTNISKDRIDSSLPYSKQNLMFCSWEANNKKGSVTPEIAKAFLKFFKERYGTDEME